MPAERIDFVDGRERLEVKSSSHRQRIHCFSLEQLIPPTGARLVIASLFVESVGGGLSLRDLSDEIRGLLAADCDLLARFDAVFYATLGAGWSEAMDERFDMELAIDSLCFFDAADIPRVVGPIPPSVTDIRFRSNLSQSTPLSREALPAAGGLFAAAAPTG